MELLRWGYGTSEVTRGCICVTSSGSLYDTKYCVSPFTTDTGASRFCDLRFHPTAVRGPRRYLLTNGASYNSIADFFTDKPVKPIAASTGTASMESQAAANLYMRNQNKPVLKGQTTTGSNGPAPSGAGGVKPAKPSTSERP